MVSLTELKAPPRRDRPKKAPRLLRVKEAFRLTPNMIRVIFAGPELQDFPTGREGGNCKLMIPEAEETLEKFGARLVDGPAPVRRTYTVRSFDDAKKELAIDFVAHGDEGPASGWAERAKPGAFLGFAGPSGPKVTYFEADWYLVAADLSALPMAAATLEAMPRDAKGVALFEITSEADKQALSVPDGVQLHWLIHPDLHRASDAQERAIRAMAWPEGRVQTCIAGEGGVIKALRRYLFEERRLSKSDVYISGYWQIGLIEDEHQALKRAEVS